MQLRKVTFLHSKNGTLDVNLGSWFLMVVEQFRKKFWNWHAKTWKNPRGPDGFSKGWPCLSSSSNALSAEENDIRLWKVSETMSSVSNPKFVCILYLKVTKSKVSLYTVQGVPKVERDYSGLLMLPCTLSYNSIDFDPKPCHHEALAL